MCLSCAFLRSRAGSSGRGRRRARSHRPRYPGHYCAPVRRSSVRPLSSERRPGWRRSLRIIRPSPELLTALAYSYLDLRELAATHEPDGHGTTDSVSGQQQQKVVGVLDRLSVKRSQDVAYDEAATPCGTAVLNAYDQQSAPLREAEPLSVREAHRLAQDAEVSALDGAPLRERPCGTPGQVCRYGERRAASPARDQDAQYVPPHVDERSSRETGIRHRVGLDVTFQPRSPPGAYRTSDGANHAKGGPRSLAARVAAHGQRDLADPGFTFRARRRLDVKTLHIKHCQVRRVIPPREPRRQGPSVSALYRQVFLALKHMARRQNFVLRKDHAAPRTTPPAVHPHNRCGDVFHRVSHTVRQGGQSIRVFHSLLLILLVYTDTLSSGY